MKFKSLKCCFLSALLTTAIYSSAQGSASKSKETDDLTGFTEIESIQGNLTSSERLFKLDSTLGWDFNKHFGVFGGVPIYFVQVPSTTTTSGTTTTTTPSSTYNGIGNAYFGLAFRAPNPAIDY